MIVKAERSAMKVQVDEHLVQPQVTKAYYKLELYVFEIEPAIRVCIDLKLSNKISYFSFEKLQ